MTTVRSVPNGYHEAGSAREHGSRVCIMIALYGSDCHQTTRCAARIDDMRFNVYRDIVPRGRFSGPVYFSRTHEPLESKSSEQTTIRTTKNSCEPNQWRRTRAAAAQHAIDDTRHARCAFPAHPPPAASSPAGLIMRD